MNHRSPRRRKITIVFACAILCPILVPAALPARGQDVMTSFLQESTVVVASIDTGKLIPPRDEAIIQRLPEPVRFDLLPVLKSRSAQLQSEADRQPVLVVVSMPVSGLLPTIHVVRRQSENEKSQNRDVSYYQQRLAGWRTSDDAQIRLKDQQILVGATVVDSLPPAAATRMARQFSSALDAAGELPIRIAMVPPAYVRSTLIQMMPTLPDSLGGLPTSVVVDGIQSFSIGFDPETFEVQVRIRSRDEAAAKTLARSLPVLVRSLCSLNLWPMDRLPKSVVAASVDKLPISVRGDTVVLRATAATVDDAHLQLLGTLVSVVSGNQRTMSATKQLKRIGLAVHNYHAAFRFLPPWKSSPQQSDLKSVKEKSNTQLSWRVHLLPFLGQNDLYQEFHLDEPWDSPHNKTLLEKMPEIYAGGSRDIPVGHTTIVAPASDQSVLNTREPTAFRNVVDGLSNTVMVVEVTADAAVPWTAPQDYEFDPQDPFAALAVDNAGNCSVLFADGAAIKLRKDVEVEQAKGLFGRFDRIQIRVD